MSIPKSHIRVDPCSFLVVRRTGLTKGSSIAVVGGSGKGRGVGNGACVRAGDHAHKACR